MEKVEISFIEMLSFYEKYIQYEKEIEALVKEIEGSHVKD